MKRRCKMNWEVRGYIFVGLGLLTAVLYKLLCVEGVLKVLLGVE